MLAIKEPVCAALGVRVFGVDESNKVKMMVPVVAFDTWIVLGTFIASLRPTEDDFMGVTDIRSEKDPELFAYEILIANVMDPLLIVGRNVILR